MKEYGQFGRLLTAYSVEKLIAEAAIVVAIFST
jgi:hypothetical protein